MTRSNFQYNTWKPLFRHLWRKARQQIYPSPILRLAIISISINKITRRISPNPISNPIHGHPCFGTFEDRQGLRIYPIQFQIPILRFVIISISRNEITHRIWPNPISNPIHGNPCFDIFEHMHDLRYTQSNFKSQYLGLPSYQWIQLTNRNHCPRVPLHETQLLKYPKIITGRRLPYVKLNLNQVLLLQCLVWSGFLLLLQKIRVPRSCLFWVLFFAIFISELFLVRF